MAILRVGDRDEITYDGDTIFELRDPAVIPSDEKDTLYTAKTGEFLRDVAFAVYREARLWWVLADLNQIVNPFEPVRPGKVLRCPPLSRLQDYLR